MLIIRNRINVRINDFHYEYDIIWTKISFRETRKSDHGKSDRGLDLSSKVPESPRKSSNNPAADFRGITDNFHNLLHNVRGADSQLFRGFAFGQIFASPQKSAAKL